MSRSLLALVLLTAISVVDSSLLPLNWVDIGDRQFLFEKTERTPFEAQSYCQQFNANLPSIHQRRENELVRNFAESSSSSIKRVWLGARSDDDEEFESWFDGTPFDYDHFLTVYRSNQSCVLMHVNSVNNVFDGRWADFPCDEQMASICVRPVQP